jgi:predicted metal-dependent phosphoesterase TrpH
LMNRPIDLHCHSTASDGSLTPEQLVAYAKAKGAGALALTDHDTIDGLDEFLEAGRKMGLETVPGLEISAAYERGTMHILGYYIDHRHAFLLQELSRLQQARQERNPKIIAKLKNMGLPLSLEEVYALAKGQIGRPHIALALVQKGIVSSVEEAFKKYLTKGGPAYVEKFRFSPVESIRMISEAGGIPVLAHPFTLNVQDRKELKKLIEELKDNGLKGLEVFYPEHTWEQTRTYEALCRELGLITTGGSDFHGKSQPSIELLVGKGEMHVPYAILSDLKNLKS